MEQDSRAEFDLFFDTDETDYDPFADFGDEEEDASEGQLGPHPEAQAAVMHVREADCRPASQRIEGLFDSMPARRRVLLGILAFLDEPRRSDALQMQVEQLQAYDVSVYSGFDFSQLLEEAGAIRKVAEDGSEFDEEAEQLPDVVEVDGVRFYKPTDGKQVFWVITEDGRAYLGADDPFGRLGELVAAGRQRQPIYQRILEFCAVEGGRKTPEIEAIVNNDPLVQNPRRYCSFFVKGLEDCGALAWSGAWTTTDLGCRALAGLFGETDAVAAEADAAADERAAEGE